MGKMLRISVERSSPVCTIVIFLSFISRLKQFVVNSSEEFAEPVATSNLEPAKPCLLSMCVRRYRGDRDVCNAQLESARAWGGLHQTLVQGQDLDLTGRVFLPTFATSLQGLYLKHLGQVCSQARCCSCR